MATNIHEEEPWYNLTILIQPNSVGCGHITRTRKMLYLIHTGLRVYKDKGNYIHPPVNLEICLSGEVTFLCDVTDSGVIILVDNNIDMS